MLGAIAAPLKPNPSWATVWLLGNTCRVTTIDLHVILLAAAMSIHFSSPNENTSGPGYGEMGLRYNEAAESSSVVVHLLNQMAWRLTKLMNAQLTGSRQGLREYNPYISLHSKFP